MPKVKISDVARLAGVSVGTVSNVLNHPGKVKAETINLVNEAIARLGYVPNQGARQLAGGQSMTFGLVLPRLDHAFSLQIANGAHDEARAHGYDILIASAGNDDILANHYMNYFLGAQMAGVLVQPMAGDSWEPPAVHASVPTVYLDVHAERLGACVGADNEAQGRLMAEHAASCGARQVAVIGNAAFGQLALRVRGIRAFGEQSGMRVEVIDRGEWNSVSDGYDLGRELAKRPEDERPDFVIALTDVLATGYIEGLASAGLDVPGDVKVAGCDGNPLAWGGSVPLTTVVSPGEEIGRRGVRMLLRLLGGNWEGASLREFVPPQLQVRASTAGRPAQGHGEIPSLNLGDYL